MSQTNDQRERSECCTGVLLLMTYPSRDEALAGAKSVLWADPPQPIVPTAHGALDCGGWPFEENGDLLGLNEAKGCLPDDADLAYGVVLDQLIVVHLLRRESDGRFSVLLSSEYVNYAKKLPEPAAEATP